MVIKQYKSSLSIKQAKGSGRKSGFKDKKAPISIWQSFTHNPGLSNREWAKRYNVSEYFVRKVRNFTISSLIEPLNIQTNQISNHWLLKLELENFMTKCLQNYGWRKVYQMWLQTVPGPKFYTSIVRGCVNKFKYKSLDKFGKKLLLWQAICSCGLWSRAFIALSTLNSDVYIKECLQARLLPFCRSHYVPCWFWPDLASCHYSKKAVEW